MAQRVLGVLGGNDADDGLLVKWASRCDSLYAADSGADRLIALGFSPIVVGDFDSFTSLPHASYLRLVQSLDQDTTDCDKLLNLVAQDGHTSVTLLASEGDLPDHVIATYSSAVASALDVRIAYRRGIGHIVKSRVEVVTTPGQRVSLVPLARCTGARLQGVSWPLENVEIAPGGRLSVSNAASGSLVTAALDSGAALLFLETQEVVW